MKIFISIMLPAILSIACLIISIFQFREKGPLLNNAYLFASKQEREALDKKPHYRQSGIVFALLTLIFLCLAVETILQTGWLLPVTWIFIAVAVLYAILSSIKISIKK